MSNILHLTNRGATALSITGHKGTPNLTLAPTANHNTTTIAVSDVVGNSILIDSLKTLVTAASLYVRYGGATGTLLDIADLEDFKSGNPFDVDLNEVIVKIEGFDFKDTATELSVTLPGDGTRRFYPQAYYFLCKTATALNGDATFDAGSTTTGTDLISGATLTGLNVQHEVFRIDVAATTAASFADNITIFAHVKAADSGTSGTFDFFVKGVIV